MDDNLFFYLRDEGREESPPSRHGKAPFHLPLQNLQERHPRGGLVKVWSCLESTRFQSLLILKMITMLSTWTLFLSLCPYIKETAISFKKTNCGSKVFSMKCPSCRYQNCCTPNTFNKNFREGIMEHIPPEQVDALENLLTERASKWASEANPPRGQVYKWLSRY